MNMLTSDSVSAMQLRGYESSVMALRRGGSRETQFQTLVLHLILILPTTTIHPPPIKSYYHLPPIVEPHLLPSTQCRRCRHHQEDHPLPLHTIPSTFCYFVKASI